MILTIDTAHPKVKIFDCRKIQIGFVQAYNTITKEITMQIPAGKGDARSICEFKNGEVLPKVITFVLEGSYAEDENENLI